MFTIKLYKYDGTNTRIYEAESFSVLRSPSNRAPWWAEITAHMKDASAGIRFDVGDSPYQPSGGIWEKAIIENAGGRTTEIIGNDVPYRAPEAQGDPQAA